MVQLREKTFTPMDTTELELNPSASSTTALAVRSFLASFPYVES